jgi:prepilin-type N-terminal cleavage/methylation domain-containing protein
MKGSFQFSVFSFQFSHGVQTAKQRRAVVRRRSDHQSSICDLTSRSPSLPVSQSPSLAVLAPLGMTLIEVLVSMAILTIGVLGVASLLPFGKVALSKTEIADRTGVLGRAALRDVKARKLLDPNLWGSTSGTAVVAAAGSSSMFFIDPLGCLNVAAPNNTSLAGLPRISLQTYPGSGTLLGHGTTTVPSVESIFVCQDDVAYTLSKDWKNGTPPNGTRPIPVVNSTTGNQLAEGKFSWFLTVSPSPLELAQYISSSASVTCLPKTYSVAVVVCNKRTFTTTTKTQDPPGEMVYSGGTCDSAIGYGGVGVSFPGQVLAKKDQWVLLVTGAQKTWYRIVGIGTITDASNNTYTHMTLVGPDWYGGGTDGTAALLVIPGVTGVYMTTVKLDEDGTWSK